MFFRFVSQRFQLFWCKSLTQKRNMLFYCKQMGIKLASLGACELQYNSYTSVGMEPVIWPMGE